MPTCKRKNVKDLVKGLMFIWNAINISMINSKGGCIVEYIWLLKGETTVIGC